MLPAYLAQTDQPTKRQTRGFIRKLHFQYWFVILAYQNCGCSWSILWTQMRFSSCLAQSSLVWQGCQYIPMPTGVVASVQARYNIFYIFWLFSDIMILLKGAPSSKDVLIVLFISILCVNLYVCVCVCTYVHMYLTSYEGFRISGLILTGSGARQKHRIRPDPDPDPKPWLYVYKNYHT